MPEKVFVRDIPDEVWRALKARASLDGMTLSQAVTSAIRGFLSGGGVRDVPADPWGGITGLGEGDERDVSERHDHYLAEAIRPARRRRPRGAS